MQNDRLFLYYFLGATCFYAGHAKPLPAITRLLKFYYTLLGAMSLVLRYYSYRQNTTMPRLLANGLSFRATYCSESASMYSAARYSTEDISGYITLLMKIITDFPPAAILYEAEARRPFC